MKEISGVIIAGGRRTKTYRNAVYIAPIIIPHQMFGRN